MKHKKYPSSDGIKLQKKYGQYFLRDASVVNCMLDNVNLKNASVFEIGCGDGFLTKAILEYPVKQLKVFEIDPSWAQKVKETCNDARLTMVVSDFLHVEREALEAGAPWVGLSNLPYHLTFPILHKLKDWSDIVPTGALMMQEEVAQKIVQTRGKGYGYVALFFQYYFSWKLLAKVLPTAFFPHPKVSSRLIAFTAKKNVAPIIEEKEFWRFIRFCFAYPRRTLRNNLAQTHIPLETFEEDLLDLRSQQMSMDDFLKLWERVRPYFCRP